VINRAPLRSVTCSSIRAALGQEWGANCMQLAVYYINHDHYRQAQHLLQAADAVIKKSYVLALGKIIIRWSFSFQHATVRTAVQASSYGR